MTIYNLYKQAIIRHVMAVLPGYNYLGPFNKLDSGEPRNPTDEEAKKHDLGYHYYLNKGENPYYRWSDVDEKFLRGIKGRSDYGAYVARGVFEAKKFLTDKLGVKRIKGTYGSC